VCFIALIEIGCYKLVSEPWSVLSGLAFVDFPVCTRMVMDYLRYLYCCVVVLICWFGFGVEVRWPVVEMMERLQRL
jgi:hypothetical protein